MLAYIPYALYCAPLVYKFMWHRIVFLMQLAYSNEVNGIGERAAVAEKKAIGEGERDRERVREGE